MSTDTSPETLHTDVAVLGAGSAGMGAFRAARNHTDRVLLIEDGPYGTTCARVGCMPSKLLIAAADAAHHARHAEGFGVHAGPVRIDGHAVMDRVRRERDRFVGFVVDTVEAWPEVARLRARARFVDAHTLALSDGRMVVADRIVIATGSRPVVPAGWREALGDRLIVNDDVFAWEALPASVAVVGAGVIGLELAQALHRLGVRVRVFARSPRVAGLTDPVVAEHAREVLARELPIEYPAEILSVAREGDGARVHWRRGDALADEHFDYVLAAMGRTPNLEGLGLEALDHAALGIHLDARGVPVSDPRTGRIGDSHLFIAGDVSGRRLLLHEASDEGRIAGDNAGRFPDIRVRPRRAGLAVVFSDPQVALAGSTYAELTADGVDFATAELDFADQGRSRVMLRNRGLIRVYGERGSGRFLGAEMIGPDAEHIGHLLAWSVQAERTVQQMLDSPFYHPVVEEGVRTALRALQKQLNTTPQPIETCLDCG